MKSGVSVVIDKVQATTKSIAALASSRVLVGYPEETAKRDGDMNNPTLAYIHEHGAPEANIPARPHLVPGIEGGQKTLVSWLEAAAKQALDGNSAKSLAALHAAGLAGQSLVRGKIQSGIPPPLKQSTVTARRRRKMAGMSAFEQAKSEYRRKATKPAHVTPLIDTAAMLNSVNYVVQQAGKTK